MTAVCVNRNIVNTSTQAFLKFILCSIYCNSFLCIPLQFTDRNLYTIRAVPLSEVKSIRRHTPPLGWQFVIVVLTSGKLLKHTVSKQNADCHLFLYNY